MKGIICSIVFLLSSSFEFIVLIAIFNKIHACLVILYVYFIFIGRVDLPDAHNEAKWRKAGHNNTIDEKPHIRQEKIAR